MATPLVLDADRERARLEALRRYAVVDSAPEREFDELVKRTARECGYPTALLSFMEADRCWFKSATGILPRDRQTHELPRSQTFCNYALSSSGTFIVADARADERFRHLPIVERPGGFRAYAGAQLVTPDGFSIGTLCVLDEVPHDPTDEQRAALRRMADLAMTMLEQRRRDMIPAGSIELAPPRIAERYVAGRDLVLVVDDEELIRGVTAAMLKRFSHDVRLAAHGRDALNCIAAENGRVRLVITDIHMPEMNGVELVHALRQLPNPPALVAMSGKFTNQILAELRDAGVIAMLAKPFGLAEIKQAIEAVQAAAR